jgi:hypothetical protein
MIVLVWPDLRENRKNMYEDRKLYIYKVTKVKVKFNYFYCCVNS